MVCVDFVLSIPLGLSFFVIKTTLTLILGLLLFQTKIFAVPKLQRQWNGRGSGTAAARGGNGGCRRLPAKHAHGNYLRIGTDARHPVDKPAVDLGQRCRGEGHYFHLLLVGKAFRALWNIAVPYLFHGKELEDIEIGGMFSFLGGEFAEIHVGKDCEGRAQSSRDLLGKCSKGRLPRSLRVQFITGLSQAKPRARGTPS